MAMWLLIPIKSLEHSKQRLAGVLPAAERRELALAMLQDVLQAVRGASSVSHILVVTSDGELAPLLGRCGIEILPELQGCKGLNGAIAAGVAHAQNSGATEILVLHGDLPLASASEIDALAASHTHGAVTLVPDSAGSGTNGLLLSLPTTMTFHFGEESFHKHCHAAEQQGLSCNVVRLPGLMFDIDTPEDLAGFSQRIAQDNDLFSARFLLFSRLPGREEALQLAANDDLPALMARAALLRDAGFHNLVTYSKKVFFPLTHLCRDVCHYCTFAQTPKFIEQAYLSLETVLQQARDAARLGCKEALLTLGEKPELRYATARKALEEMGFASTLHYVAHVAGEILKETGILPHINAGCMTSDELAMLRKVSASMGLMVESTSLRLCEKGMPHYGSPDKQPERRLETLRLAGEQKIPFTTGILIGIGETRAERIESLLAIREIHQQYGHIQEIIIQNFRAKPDTLMANAPEPSLNELLWTIAVARILFGSAMSIQAPPNLSPGVLPQLVNAGINDWGGVSPVTPDFVNPEAPWPHLEKLAQETLIAGKRLHERLTIYPAYVVQGKVWLDPALQFPVMDAVDGEGFPREDEWLTGSSEELPGWLLQRCEEAASPDISRILEKPARGELLSERDMVRLFAARGSDFAAVCQRADELRQQQSGDEVTFVINRNINYTNICYFHCRFCAFSKGKQSDALRGKPYDLLPEEIERRTTEAWARGASEVCMQGGIHPSYTGENYVAICQAVKRAVPQMHIHAFSPLEIWQGAATLGLGLREYLLQLKEAGLGTLPGTAAEVLDDEVREILCPDKINTAQWLEVMRVAHSVGIRSTATIMFGHVDNYHHWARHILRVRDLQRETGGFTEFVPLPFVAPESPIYRRRGSRKGPTLRECLLMHAVARIALHPFLPSIQTSWVKLGEEGACAALQAGASDLGGTLMNESITRSAGASHGEELGVERLEAIIRKAGRSPRLRNTLYGPITSEREAIARSAGSLTPIILNDPSTGLGKSRLLKPGATLDPRDLKDVG